MGANAPRTTQDEGRGFTRDGKWAPSAGQWLAARITFDMAELLCDREWSPGDVLVLSIRIGQFIDRQIARRESKGRRTAPEVTR